MTHLLLLVLEFAIIVHFEVNASRPLSMATEDSDIEKCAFGKRLVDFELGPGDVFFLEPVSPRTVLVPPEALVLLVDQKINQTRLVLKYDRAPKRGEISFDWLPGVKVIVTTLDELSMPIGTGGDPVIEEAFGMLFKGPRLNASHIDAWFRKEFDNYCADDLYPNNMVDKKLRSILNVFHRNRQYLSLFLRNMPQSCWDDSYRGVDEIVMDCTMDLLSLRIHLWYGVAGVGWHDHGHGATFVSSLFMGSLTQLVFDHQGIQQTSVQVGDGYVYTIENDEEENEEENDEQEEAEDNDDPDDSDAEEDDEDASKEADEEEETVEKFNWTLMPATGHVARVESGSHYLFPSRWVHAVQSEGVTLSLELRLTVSSDCKNNSPNFVRVDNIQDDDDNVTNPDPGGWIRCRHDFAKAFEDDDFQGGLSNLAVKYQQWKEPGSNRS